MPIDYSLEKAAKEARAMELGFFSKTKKNLATGAVLAIYTYYGNADNRLKTAEIMNDTAVDADSEFYNKHVKYYHR